MPAGRSSSTPSHTPHPPRTGDPEPSTLDGLDLDEALIEDSSFTRETVAPGEYRLVDWESCTLDHCTLAATRWPRSHFTDVRIADSDLANVELERAGVNRVVVERTRMTGFNATKAMIQNLRADDCLAEMSTWRFAQVERAVFTGCKLARSDWTAAQLSQVRFEDCDLTGADFSEARLTQVSFARCTFIDLQGLTGLRGAAVDADGLVQLTGLMAREFGIRMLTED